VVRKVNLPESFAGLPALARGTINHYERAACMAFEWDNHRAALSPQMRRYIEAGLNTSRVECVGAWRRVEQCRALLPKVFEDVDVLLTPCVPGEAPKGLASTGDPSMQAMWTALHTPSMTLPTHRGRTICRSAFNWSRRATRMIGCSPARAGFGSRSARRIWSRSVGSR